MPYKDKETQRAYQNQWAKNRRLQWIASKGGRCAKCGSTHALEVDHIDRNEKVTHRVWTWSAARRNEELSKCQVLCYNCHIEKTAIENGRLGCGTKASYDRGCRCQECKDANAAHRRGTRAARRLQEEIGAYQV